MGPHPHHRWRTTAARRRLLPALLLCVLSAGLPLMAAGVVAVLSSDADPYRRSAAELANGIADGGHTARSVLLDQLQDGDLAQADCIVAIGSAAAAAMHVRPGLGAPLVYCMVTDAAATGLYAGAPACGVEAKVPLTIQLALLAEALPRARRVGMLINGDEAGAALAASVRAALPADWELKAVACSMDRLADEIGAVTTGVDVVWTSPDGSLYTDATVRSLLLNALRRRVPVFGFSPSFVRAGALFGVGIDPAAQGGQAALLVKEALARRSAGQAAEARRLAPAFEIAVNLVVAEKLGIELPAQLVARATHVFRPER
jgi:ABC-type uncharacterized transport system substrate-binding protein